MLFTSFLPREPVSDPPAALAPTPPQWDWPSTPEMEGAALGPRHWGSAPSAGRPACSHACKNSPKEPAPGKAKGIHVFSCENLYCEWHLSLIAVNGD